MAIMAMGRQEQRARQRGLWIARTKPAIGLGRPLHQLLRELPDAGKSDAFVEARYVEFHAGKYGCPLLALGIYFQRLPVECYESIQAERGIAC